MPETYHTTIRSEYANISFYLLLVNHKKKYMGMDVYYIVGKQAIEQLEKLLSNQEHG